MGKQKTHEQFVSEMKIQHPNIQILSPYINSKTKLLCKCLIDNYEWMQTPNSLQQGIGCPKCNNYMRMNNEEFLSEFYSKNNTIEIKSKYKNRRTPLLCECKIDGYQWNAYPYDLLHDKCRCRRCLNKEKYTTESFRNIMYKINPNISIIGNYINNKTPIECECKICGFHFYPPPGDIKNNKTGCPNCKRKDSVLESNVIAFLKKNNINYEHPKKFDGLKGVGDRSLSYDFYLTDYNKLLECQGEQHFKPIKYFGGIDKFEIQLEHDKRKRQFAEDHNIEMIEIVYSDRFNIDNVLKEKLGIKCA